MFKIKVINCSSEDYWYQKEVGKTFYVTEETDAVDNQPFYKKGDDILGFAPEDCEIINPIKMKLES